MQRTTENQKQRFIKKAREIGCDEDEAHWDERLKKVAKPEPATPAKTPKPE